MSAILLGCSSKRVSAGAKPGDKFTVKVVAVSKEGTRAEDSEKFLVCFDHTPTTTMPPCVEYVEVYKVSSHHKSPISIEGADGSYWIIAWYNPSTSSIESWLKKPTRKDGSPGILWGIIYLNGENANKLYLWHFGYETYEADVPASIMDWLRTHALIKKECY